MSGYVTLKNDLQNLLVDGDFGGGNPSQNFTDILPSAILYSESRIYQDLDFLSTRQSDSSLTFTSGNREITVPTTTIIIEGLAAITPAGNTPAAGTRNPLERVSLDYIDMTWPVEATTGLPTVYAMKTNTTAVVAPTPGAAYKAEFTGIFTPTTLSSGNPDTYLTRNYYNLMLACSMVFLTGWQQNFGASSDNPQMSLSWEGEYQKLKAGAMADALRQKASMPGGDSYPPTPADKG